MELGTAQTPPDNWCFICWLCHVSLLDQHQRLEGWHHRWKCLAHIHCWVWNWYSCNLQAIFGNCKEVPLLKCDTYCLLFLPSLFLHVFEFVKNIEAHDRPIKDLAFDRFFLRLASTGASYPKSGAWAMLQQVLQILFINSPHPSLDSIHTFARVYILLIKVKASWSPIPNLIPCKLMCLILKFFSLTSLFRMKYTIKPWTLKSSCLLQTRM